LDNDGVEILDHGNEEERNENEEEVERPDVPEDLQLNWSVEEDPLSGDFYFYNCATHTSRWTRPQLEQGWEAIRDQNTGEILHYRNIETQDTTNDGPVVPELNVEAANIAPV
jgi:hypothetical protein